MAFPVKPLGDRVIVELIETENTTVGGLLLPTGSAKFRFAKVVAVGRGNITAGEVVPLEVQVDDTVQLTAHTGDILVVDGKEYLMVSERVIVAVLDSKAVKPTLKKKQVLSEAKNTV